MIKLHRIDGNDIYFNIDNIISVTSDLHEPKYSSISTTDGEGDYNCLESAEEIFNMVLAARKMRLKGQRKGWSADETLHV